MSAHRFLCVSILLGVSALHAQSPRWIWTAEESGPSSGGTFQRTFDMPAVGPIATLSGVADFCQLTVKINGQVLTVVDPYQPSFQEDVAASLRAGRNVLEVQATAVTGPAAFALRLDLGATQASERAMVTDRSWTCMTTAGDSSRALPSDRGEVTEYELDPRRQLSISAVDDYEQWRQASSVGQGTDPASFVVTPGFEIDLLHSARPDEGSWVSMAIDPQGRIIIAREDRGLLRMTLAEDRDSVAKVETLNDTLLECRGILFAHGKLYVNANNSKGLYQLSDQAGKDRFDRVRLLRQFDGGVGHGRNDLALGPDGMIYSIQGDSVDLPKDCQDLTSPYREHRQGKKSSEGFLIRTDAEGTRWELVSAGLRNPFGIAFHPDGEPFTYDADAEFDMGSPWYRPTQVKHLVAGTDFGWRGVTGRWPPYYPDHPDNAQPSVHIGKGSPTSVLFGTRSDFPQPYRDALFILDWAYGRILAVHLTPRGASYTGKPETFLKGRPLNVTDLDFGPDGAMYFVTGGRKTQAALYRVRYVGPKASPPAPSLQQQARARHATEQRQVRRNLEALLARGPSDHHAVDQAWPLLGDPDPTIRFAARTVLEHQPLELWSERALQLPIGLAKLNALLGLARSGEKSLVTKILDGLQPFDLAELSATEKSAALYTFRLCLNDKTNLSQELLTQIEQKLAPLYPDPVFEVNQHLSFLLVDLHSPQVLGKTISLLAHAKGQVQHMHYLFVIRNVATPWTLAQRESFFQALDQAQQYQGGEGMPGFLRKIRDDFVATLTADEKEKFASFLAATPTEEVLPPARPLVKQWTLDELRDVAAKRDKEGDWENGKRLFASALCSRCHRVGTIGKFVGPDLTSVGSRFSRSDIVRSIIDPSAVVAENYQNDRVETVDGRVLVGRLIESSDYRSTVVKVATDPLRPDQATEITKKDIALHDKVPTSPMPAGLLNTLTINEIRDLLLFVESGGSP